MKRQARRLLALSLVIFPVVYAASCGQEIAARPTEQNSKVGQNEALNQASVATTVSTQNKAPEDSPSLTSNLAPTVPSVLDVPEASPGLENNPALPNPALGASPDPLWSQLPYYCDPRAYAPNIINNNKACQRFQPIPYIGFGQDRGPGPGVGYGPDGPDLGLYPPGPIGYRLKHHVGRIGRDDDDDDGRHGKWKSYRRH